MADGLSTVKKVEREDGLHFLEEACGGQWSDILKSKDETGFCTK